MALSNNVLLRCFAFSIPAVINYYRLAVSVFGDIGSLHNSNSCLCISISRVEIQSLGNTAETSR